MSLSVSAASLADIFGWLGKASSAKKDDPKECNPAKDDHWKCLEIRGRSEENVRRKATKDTSQKLDGALGLVDPSAAKSILRKGEKYIFDLARRINFSTDNWMLLSAAEQTLYQFWIGRGRDDSLLEKAELYLRFALAREDRSVCFDVYRSPGEVLNSATIYPIEAYFELKLTLFQVVMLTRPREAMELGRELEARLKDPRFLAAQRSNPVSSEGYLNRLNILRALAGIYHPQLVDTSAALAFAEQGNQWASQKYSQWIVSLKADGMNRKDLRHDVLNSEAIKGRLLMKVGRYREAQIIFQRVLAAPETTQKYGGFLDLGKQAFLGLLLIALATSSSTAEAAEKFGRAVDWNKLPDDFKESLGLLVRKRPFGDKICDYSKIKCPSWRESAGEITLQMGWVNWAPEDSSATLSRIPAGDLSTPEKRLKTMVRLLDYIEIPFDLRFEVQRQYNLLAGREVK